MISIIGKFSGVTTDQFPAPLALRLVTVNYIQRNNALNGFFNVDKLK